MALIECLECKKQVSSEANACPHCGISIKKDTPIIVSPTPTHTIPLAQTHLIEPGFEPTWGNIFFGILLIFLCTWLAFFFIPSHNPEVLEKFMYNYPGKIAQDLLQQNPAEAIAAIFRLSKGKLPDGCPEWVFSKEHYLYIIVSSYVFLALGIIIALSGFFHKDYKILFCQHCNSQTIARKKFLGFLCEKCNTNLKKTSLPLLLLVLLVLLFFLIISKSSTKSLKVGSIQNQSYSTNIRNFSKTNSQSTSWIDRAELGLRVLLKKPGQYKIFGSSIVSTLHPSGNYKNLTYGIAKQSGILFLNLNVEWSGAITKTIYTTSIIWRCNQSGHINISVIKDNAPFKFKQANLNLLDKWFREQVWPIVNSNAG